MSRHKKLLRIMTNDFDIHWKSSQLIVLRMTPRVTGKPSLPATHQVISLGPEGECHVITSRVSCHVIFAMACHNSGSAALCDGVYKGISLQTSACQKTSTSRMAYTQRIVRYVEDVQV